MPPAPVLISYYVRFLKAVNKKKMIVKIICPCYKEEFFPAGNECINESIHFKCTCRRKDFFKSSDTTV